MVNRGLYRLVRNPMYLGVAFVLIGEAVYFVSILLAIYALLVVVGFHLFVVLYEEPGLKKKFGASYDGYCQRVPRWIPRINVHQKIG